MAERGVIFAETPARQIAKAAREFARRTVNEKPNRGRFNQREDKRLQAILVEDLPAAVNTKRDPSTARCRILSRKRNGDLRLTRREKLVVNRFQNISVPAGTYLKIEHIDGEWQPYAADCPGQDSSLESFQ